MQGRTLTAALVAAFLLAPGAALAALCPVPGTKTDCDPGDTCTAAYADLEQVAATDRTQKIYCDGTQWRVLRKTDTSGAATSRVGQGIKLGADSAACDSDTEGTIRYASGNSCIELCDGTSWSCVAAAACSDALPDSFSFTDLVNQTVSTQVTSDIVQITGLSCQVNVQLSGEGAPEYRLCSDSSCSTVTQDWTTGQVYVENNEYVQLRLTTSAAGGDTYSATLAVGNGAAVWNATTEGDCTGSPAVGTVCADGTVYAGLSPDGSVPMYVTRCDAGMSWDGTACTGTRLGLSWNDGDANWVETSLTSNVTGELNTSQLAAIDSNDVTSGHQDHVAAVHCENLSHAGHSDWYLPALGELNILYNNQTVIGGFSAVWYWSSSEDYTSAARRQRFSDGNQSYGTKSSTSAVRCARR
jgi:hypothetical protein